MKKTFHILIYISMPLFSIAQVLYPESEHLDYQRILEIKNPSIESRLNIFPSIISPYDTDSIDWDIWQQNSTKTLDEKVSLLPLRWSNHFNSEYARGYNDGALWKGKGLTSSLQGGIQGKIGMLEYTLAPIVFYSQNADFQLAPQSGGNSIYNYQFRNARIDYVQRYGDDSFTRFNPGQSEVRLVHKSVTLGISTQNLTWGPGQQNALI
ncbi:MAG: hypothetical protein ABJ019_12325, partial [Ekhidna sp.]